MLINILNATLSCLFEKWLVRTLERASETWPFKRKSLGRPASTQRSASFCKDVRGLWSLKVSSLHQMQKDGITRRPRAEKVVTALSRIYFFVFLMLYFLLENNDACTRTMQRVNIFLRKIALLSYSSHCWLLLGIAPYFFL